MITTIRSDGEWQLAFDSDNSGKHKGWLDGNVMKPFLNASEK